MKKLGISLVFVLAIAAITSITNPTIGYALTGNNSKLAGIESSDRSHVGLVVAYQAGQSITIMDRDGNKITFEIAPSLKIVPADRASSLAIGAYVTIIAPNNTQGGKLIAVGIVIHPGVPPGFPMPSQTSTPVPVSTDTLVPTDTSIVETATLTETATSTEVSVTPTDTSTVTETPTANGTLETPTSTTASSASTNDQQSILEALRSILQQILAKL